MPTFPSPPLKFRTAGFPRYGLKAGISDGAFPTLGLPSSFVPFDRHRNFPAQSQGRCGLSAPPRERYSALPQEPSLRPGYAVPALSA